MQNKQYKSKSKRYIACHNNAGIKFPEIYDEDFSFFCEAIRVESHLKKNKRQVNISNKNLIFMEKIETTIRKYVSKKSIYKNVSIELDIPKDKKVLEVNKKDKKMNFHTYKASRSKKFKLKFYDKLSILKQNYTIKLSEKGKIKVNINEINGEIISQSNYGIVSTVLNLTACSTTFARLLNILIKIPFGKKSETIFIPTCLKKSPKKVKIEAINAVLDSESWIDKNRVRIGINSRTYLEDLKEIFNEFKVYPSIENKNPVLSINNKKELKKFKEHFNFSLERKANILKNIET